MNLHSTGAKTVCKNG